MSAIFKKKQMGPVVLIVAVALICLVVFLLLSEPAEEAKQPGDTSGAVQESNASTEQSGETYPAAVDELQGVSISLAEGMRITEVGRYIGIYMEDGSDEIVSGVMMIAVTNEGENDIQYAEITMPVGDKTASFTLTTLPVGETVILLEKNRMEYVPGVYTEADIAGVALFQTPLSLCEDRIQTQILDGAINVTNISDEDITGDVVIYYKNSAVDVYYGGITYRVRLEGGLKTGEVRQVMASHFSESGSSIMFITCGEN